MQVLLAVLTMDTAMKRHATARNCYRVSVELSAMLVSTLQLVHAVMWPDVCTSAAYSKSTA